MNANDLWVGNDYAFSRFIRKGEKFVDGAERVRVHRILKRREFGKDRMSAYAIVDFVADDGSVYRHGTEVRVRDIFMRWNEYEDEVERHAREKDRIAKEREETASKERAEKERIISSLEAKGIPTDGITITPYSVCFPRGILHHWLFDDE